MFKRMDYCEINRQLEYLIIIVETVTSPEWLVQDPGLLTLSFQFYVGPGTSLSRPSLLMFVARAGRGDEREGPRPPVALPGLTHCTVATPPLLVLLAGKYLARRARSGERGETITHPTFLCSMPLTVLQ